MMFFSLLAVKKENLALLDFEGSYNFNGNLYMKIGSAKRKRVQNPYFMAVENMSH